MCIMFSCNRTGLVCCKYKNISYELDNIDLILLLNIIEYALEIGNQTINILLNSITFNDKGTTSGGIWISGAPLQVCYRPLSSIYTLQISHDLVVIKMMMCLEGCDTLHLIEHLGRIIGELTYSHCKHPTTITWIIL